jgi:hypothetical protein
MAGKGVENSHTKGIKAAKLARRLARQQKKQARKAAKVPARDRGSG